MKSRLLRLLREADTEDLIAELEGRHARGDHCPSFDELYEAFALGRTDSAIQIARLMAQFYTGRILP